LSGRCRGNDGKNHKERVARLAWSPRRRPGLQELADLAAELVDQVGLLDVGDGRVGDAVTNVPGPQVPLYAAGAKLLEMFPVVPLAAGQAVSIGLTSYDGGVYYGLNADRDAMADVDVLASLIEESLAEMVAASAGGARRGPRTRARPQAGEPVP
jgi:hypothetical protein